MNNDPKEVLDFTNKQRLQLLANLIMDKVKEDIAQGQPLLKQIEAEKAAKRRSKLNKPPLKNYKSSIDSKP